MRAKRAKLIKRLVTLELRRLGASPGGGAGWKTTPSGSWLQANHWRRAVQAMKRHGPTNAELRSAIAQRG